MSTLTMTRRGVLADAISPSILKDAALVLGAVAITALAAQVSVHIPGTPVPVTGQTFASLTAGAALGWRRGGMAMALYVAGGSLGIPWFTAGSSGLFGASAGYLVGMALATVLVGALADRGGDRSVPRTVATMIAASIVIYLFGMGWLVAATGISITTGLTVGVLPFLVGDAIKIALAAAVLPASWRLVGQHAH